MLRPLRLAVFPLLLAACTGDTSTGPDRSSGSTSDAGHRSNGGRDAATDPSGVDAGTADALVEDARPSDAGAVDSGASDADAHDASGADGSARDAGRVDVVPDDAGPADAGVEDASSAETSPSTGQDCTSSDVHRYACCVLDEVNAFRAEQGLPAYEWDAGVDETAFWYANYMADNGVFAHSADGRNFGERLDDFDVAWTSAGENLQRNSLRSWEAACDETVNGPGGWRNSRSGHREAMLGQDSSGSNKRWTHAAAGVAFAGGQWYVAMYFVRF